MEEVDTDHPLTALRLALRREELITEIELTPLNATEVTALAQDIATNHLTMEQIEQLYADTEGNPLFVVETVRARLSRGAEEGEGIGEVQPLSPLHPSSPHGH